jgi:hypothetical protein
MSVSCRRASELISQSMDRALSRRERFALGLHLLICTYCCRFRDQLRLLRRLMREHFNSSTTEPIAGEWRLSDEARARIGRAIGHQP